MIPDPDDRGDHRCAWCWRRAGITDVLTAPDGNGPLWRWWHVDCLIDAQAWPA